MTPHRMKPVFALATASVVSIVMLVALLPGCDRGSASTKLAAAKRALEKGNATLALRLVEEAEGQLSSSEDASALGFAAGLCRTRALVALRQGSRAVRTYQELIRSYPSLATAEDDRDIMFALIESEDREAAVSLIVWAIESKRPLAELGDLLMALRALANPKPHDVEVSDSWSWWAWASPPEVDYAAHVEYMNGR